jgi:hypothetical protein
MVSHNSHWKLLFGRTLLFIAIQAFFALVFALVGDRSAWESGANLWAFGVTIANLVCVVWMVMLFKQEDQQYWNLFCIKRNHLKKDLLVLAGIMLVAGPIGYFPNVWLGAWLFGDPLIPLDLLLRPLPYWAAVAAVILFPLTQGLAELPLYFACVMPRLVNCGYKRWMAISIPAAFLGLQHFAIPLLFNSRYFLWRSLMFMPFAFLLGVVLHWRPRLLPYLVIIHIIMDLNFALMLIGKAY